ncbi:MAG: hypothetical protein R2865_17945 [Deinococcales bacterium]
MTSPRFFLNLNQVADNDLKLSLELQNLKRYQQDPVLLVSPMLVVSAKVEESFYRLNNLPQQLSKIFSPLKPQDPDEDIVEECAEEALNLLRGHYLLDEVIDGFYEALDNLKLTQLFLRRPDPQEELLGIRAQMGRPSLLALKELWLQAWQAEEVLKRLKTNQSIALAARSVVIHHANFSASKLAHQGIKKAWLDAQGRLLAMQIT